MARAFERYWISPASQNWNVDGSTWLDASFLRCGDYESSEGCFMTLREDGEVWELCRDAARSLDGKAPFVVSRYRPIRA